VYKSGLQVYRANRWRLDDGQTSSGSEAGSGNSEITLEPISLPTLLRKVTTSTECLTDGNGSLDSPAADQDDLQTLYFLSLNYVRLKTFTPIVLEINLLVLNLSCHNALVKRVG
jgi:hypothetical protein